MPRKQRFKPSRKPKIVATPTDLTVVPASEPTTTTEAGQVVFDATAHVRKDTGVFASAVDVAGETS
jgi:hypothetical protein